MSRDYPNRDERDLTFKRLRDVSWGRAKYWHIGKSWTPSEWMTAFVGEVGEAANIIKKMNRFRDGLPGNKPGVTPQSLHEGLAEELADCMIYLDLLAASIGVDLEEEVIKKFNKTSERLGFEERL